MKEYNTKIKNAAEKIVELEKQLQNGDCSEKRIGEQMESAIASLSWEDLFAIDEYIMSKNLLTK
jgi:hypothetical protein